MPLSPNFELELPARFATSERQQAQAYLSKLFRQHSLRLSNQSDEVAFFHSSASLVNSLSIHHLAYGREIHNAGGPSGDTYIAVFTLAGTLRMQVGSREIVSSAGTLCVMNPHQSFKTQLSADHEQLTLCIPGALLRQQLGAAGLQLVQPLEFRAEQTSMFDRAGTLTNVLITLCHELRREGSAICRPQIGRHFEQMIAGLLLAEVEHNYTTANEPVPELAPAYVREALQFIHTHANTRISIEEIAAAAGVTPRALQIAFRRYIGTTPRMYLRNVRLDHAQRSLSDDMTHRVKLSNVAQDNGFANPSKFARHFRERFGSNPSAILRRRTS